MPRGFTLLELLITLSVIGIIMAWVSPNFNSIAEREKMSRLAKELNGFVLMSKSEAVMRRQSLWAHMIMSGSSNSTGEWKLSLTDSITEGGGTEFMVLSGEAFDGITISTTYTSKQISFDHTHGRPKSGRFTFYPVNDVSAALELRTHLRSAIVRVCSPYSSFHLGYEGC